jgi:NAD+ synthase
MPASVYREVVAATNMKQRVRKTLEYFHAERTHSVVVGTPNRLEYELGFFVRGGDGLADVKPIAHLYKTQVYALASHLGLPRAILEAVPTTDTYSLPQSQEEFYFGLPLDALDLLVYGSANGVPPADAAGAVGLEPEAVERVYADLESKRRAAELNLADAILVDSTGV